MQCGLHVAPSSAVWAPTGSIHPSSTHPRYAHRMALPDPSHVTLLVTDVVDSVAWAQEIGEERSAEVWQVHDRLARKLLEQHDGREIDKSDGFLLLFEDPTHALAYASAYHAALRTMDPPLVARAGVHCGAVQLVPTPREDVARGAKPLEVLGLPKSVAARIMGIAPAGVTLVSGDALQAAGAPDARSHGHWMLKGMAEPLEVFDVELEHAPTPVDGAKAWRVVQHEHGWRPARDIPCHLPAERDAFVGRLQDLQELADLIDANTRLVSVLGIGGCGKTRLIIRYAWSNLTRFPGGAWFCDLSEARSLEGVVAVVGSTLGVSLPSEDPAGQLGPAIAGRGRCLIVLDNFEQVGRHAEETLGRWLDAAPEAMFVVTTREVLGLPGEVTFDLRPLDTESAVELFVKRARASRRDFTVGKDEHDTVVALVRLLDQLPLAIELAAARVRAMPLQTILDRMGERFRLLTSRGARRDRQATMLATLDWSWDLLDDDERSALAQLGSFEGGFDLAAAEAVIAAPGAWPVDLVTSLVDKSLVRAVSDTRFDLLVSMQTYAKERDPTPEATAARHARYYADTWGDASEVPSDELDNLIIAARRAQHAGDLEVAAQALRAAWLVHQFIGAGDHLLEMAIEIREAADPGSLAWARATTLQGQIDVFRGSPAHARSLLQQGTDALERHGEITILLDGQVGLGLAYLLAGARDDARTVLSSVARRASELGLADCECAALLNLSILDAADPENPFDYDYAAELARKNGLTRLEGNFLTNRGHDALLRGDLRTAQQSWEAALEIHRELGNRRSEAIVLTNLSQVDAETGGGDVIAQLEHAIVLHRQVLSRRAELISRMQGAHWLLMSGAPSQADQWLDEAEALLPEGVVHPFPVAPFRAWAHLLRDELAEARSVIEAHEASPSHEEGLENQCEGARIGALVLLAHGDVDGAQAAIARVDDAVRAAQRPLPLATLLATRAQIALERGDGDDARRSLDEASTSLDPAFTRLHEELAGLRARLP